MDEISVSVITPAYNMAEFLPATIRSVQAQTLKNIEHIIIDDGSTDETGALLASFGDSIIPRRIENSGACRARNLGVSLARGRAIMFLDADDFISPNTLEVLRDALGDATDCIVYGTCSDLYLRDGEWKAIGAPQNIHPPEGDPILGLLKRNWSVYPCAELWPRALLDRIGEFDESCAALQDFDMRFRALLAGAQLVAAPEAHSFYRRHESQRTSISQSHHKPEVFESRIRVIGKIVDNLHRKGLYEKYRIAAAQFYFGLAMTHFRYHPEGAVFCSARAWEMAGWDSMPLSWPRRLVCRAVGFANYRSLARVFGSG